MVHPRGPAAGVFDHHTNGHDDEFSAERMVRRWTKFTGQQTDDYDDDDDDDDDDDGGVDDYDDNERQAVNTTSVDFREVEGREARRSSAAIQYKPSSRSLATSMQAGRSQLWAVRLGGGHGHFTCHFSVHFIGDITGHLREI